MDIVQWIAASEVPPQNLRGEPEDWELFRWLIEGHLDDNYIVNRTAFSEYPRQDLVEVPYPLFNDVRPFDRWVVVTHPLKADWMWIDVAQYYLALEW